MKKVLFTVLALSSAAFAGTTSTTVTINAEVRDSCVFDVSTTAATLVYQAGSGITSSTPGAATLYCNKGTTVSAQGTGPVDPLETNALATFVFTTPVTLTKTGSDTLSVAVGVTTAPGTSPTTGTYTGANLYNFTVTPDAANTNINQWGASTGSYTGFTTITVTF